MPLLLACFALVLALWPGGPARAQVRAAPAPAGLYAALGGKAGIDRVVADFILRLQRHPRLGAHFKAVKPGPFRDSLAEQLCWMTGGPCVFQGADRRDMHADMQGIHADLRIGKADFNALVETLQDAMDAQGIPFAQQNRLLALLAPLHRDIVTVH